MQCLQIFCSDPTQLKSTHSPLILGSWMGEKNVMNIFGVLFVAVPYFGSNVSNTIRMLM